MAAKLVEQWLKIAKGETMTISGQNLIVVNKEYVQSSHSPIILNKGLMYSDSNKEVTVESESIDEPMANNEIIDRDEIDSDKDVIDESNCNKGLVYKFTVKDGKQILAKVSDSSSPKKMNMHISRSNDSAISSDSDESKLHKSRNSVNTTDTKSKDEKYSGDRSKSKDRSRDKDRKSSSSASLHKTSSSSSKPSSSKHGSSSSSNNHSSSSSKSQKSSSGSSKVGSSSSSNSSREKSKDKRRSSTTSQSKSFSNSSRDKEKRDDKDGKSKSEASKISQADKDKATLAKVLPQSITKIGKIPKRSSTGDDKNDKSSSESAADVKAAIAKKKSISIEVRKEADRPKTVKTYNSQFRSHGLAEEAPPPPSRRDLKKPSTAPTPGITLLSNPLPGKRSLSPSSSASKEFEKKIKVASPTIEKPGAIKLIPAKPKRKYFPLIDFTNFDSHYLFAARVFRELCERYEMTVGAHSISIILSLNPIKIISLSLF